VYYSLLSACANCQNRSWLHWSPDYDANCSTIYDQTFHDTIPLGTKIPHYAYLDVITDNNFNVMAAENADGPESIRKNLNCLFCTNEALGLQWTKQG